MVNRRTFIAAVSGGLATHSNAQPGKMTRIVVGFSPGGAVDIVARIYADELRSAGGGNFMVDNKAGAGGRIGVQNVKDAPVDGSTLLLTPSSVLTIYPHVYKKLPYDSVKDLVAIAPACEYYFGLAVGPGTPATTLPEFIDWAKKNPKIASYGSPGSGTGPHFMGAMLAKASGVSLTHVPYRGGASALQDIIGGQLPALITTVPNLLPHHRSGKIRILAQTADKRLTTIPDVPSFKELGFNDLSLREWFGFFGPAGMSHAMAASLHAALTKASRERAVGDALAKQGFDAMSGDLDALARLVKSDLAAWGPIVKATGFSPEE